MIFKATKDVKRRGKKFKNNNNKSKSPTLESRPLKGGFLFFFVVSKANSSCQSSFFKVESIVFSHGWPGNEAFLFSCKS